MLPTLSQLADDLAAGVTTSRGLVETCLDRIGDPAGEGARTFLTVHADTARSTADAIDQRRRAGEALPRFAGIPISIKDLFDEAGQVTTAGSRILRDSAPATADAEVVARLRAAGFVLVGRTNMTEFAYSGIGYNPHYGTPANPWDRATGRVPGGSSSGAAVSVADGMAFAAIGTDTGGSCRVPAAFCGITGFKPTQSRVSRAGVLPLSQTLDTVGPLGASVACCAALLDVLSGTSQGLLQPIALAGLRLGVPRNVVLDGLEPHVAESFENALRALSAAGANVEEFDFPPLDQLSPMSGKGGISAADSYAWHRRRGFPETSGEYDSRVATRILKGAEQSAADYLDLLDARQRLIAGNTFDASSYDVLLFPTTPIVAPALSAIADDEAFFRLNGLALRNPSIVNLLDGCAISIPCQAPGTAPVGLMVVGRNGDDKRLLAIAEAMEARLKP